MSFDVFGNEQEAPPIRRKRGLTAMIRESFASRFDGTEFSLRLVGWGNKRGHILYELAWDITTFPDGREYPSERDVKNWEDRLGGAADVQFDLRPRKLPGFASHCIEVEE